jgi:hypothetical protein
MANEFDPYRDALVVESLTLWPDEYDGLSGAEKDTLAQRLHAAPQQAAELQYERQHTGFTRVIRVTPADLERVR